VRPHVFTDLAEMVREMPELQAADVTVESGFLHTVAMACMEAGLTARAPYPTTPVSVPLRVKMRGSFMDFLGCPP
jgi:hypothetical protein